MLCVCVCVCVCVLCLCLCLFCVGVGVGVCVCVCVSELLENVDPTLGNAAVAAVLVELVSPLLLVLSGVCVPNLKP
jgi:hypothetical protein